MGLLDFFNKSEEKIETTEDREKRVKFILIGIGVVLFVVIYAFMSSTGTTQKPKRNKQEGISVENPLENVDVAKEEWTLRSAARIRALEEQTVKQERRLQRLEKQNQMLMDSLRGLSSSLMELSNAIYELKDNVLKTPLNTLTTPPASEGNKDMPVPSGTRYPAPFSPSKKKGEDIKIITPETGQKSDTDTIQMAALPMQKTRKVLLPTGSFARVVFLAGVFAPCGTQDVPVLMKVVSPVITPKNRKNFIGSFIIGAAIGDESSKSALIRLQKIAFLYNDSVVVRPIKGWVVGKDGKYGIRGKIHDRSGKYIAYALLSGFASGVGSAVQGAYTEVIQNPFGQTTYKVDNKQVARVAAASGAANAANTLSDYFMKKADKIVPVVELPAGTVADIVLLDDLTI